MQTTTFKLNRDGTLTPTAEVRGHGRQTASQNGAFRRLSHLESETDGSGVFWAPLPHERDHRDFRNRK